MEWKELFKTIGKGVINMLPYGSLVTRGIQGIGEIADIVGGEAGNKIQSGIKTITEGLNQVGQTPMPPEIQARILETKQAGEIEMARINYEEKKLTYEDAAGGREVVKTALLSDDPIVRQARPRMMVKLGNACIVYVFYAPLSVIAAGYMNVSAATMTDFMGMLRWIGGFLFSTFITSFTGYTVARSADKKIAAGGEPGKVLNMIAGLGRKIA